MFRYFFSTCGVLCPSGHVAGTHTSTATWATVQTSRNKKLCEIEFSYNRFCHFFKRIEISRGSVWILFLERSQHDLNITDVISILKSARFIHRYSIRLDVQGSLAWI